MFFSLSSIVGLLAGFAILAWTISHETSNWMTYVSFPSLLIVLGGTTTVTLVGFRTKYVVSAFVGMVRIYMHQPITPKSLVGDVRQFVEWSRKVQVDGNRAFDAIANESKDDFIRYIFALASTGYTIEDIRNFGETNIEEEYFRQLQASHILQSMGSMTPAMGLVGTLLGLITMLGKLTDPASLGPGLALALTATLYGLLFARFFFLPTSTKIKQILSIERFRDYLILEGLVLLMERRSTMYIQDRLNSFLDRKAMLNLQAKG
jgi:chemotaxis protein MotA